MNGRCRMPGRPCPRLATIVVRIPLVGDRDLCYHCWQALVGLGMDGKPVRGTTTSGTAA